MLMGIFLTTYCDYLWRMRLMMSFILSCLIFAAPQLCEAGGIQEYKANYESSSCIKKNLLQQPLTDNCINTIEVPGQNNHSGARFKVFPWMNFSSSSYSPGNCSFFEENRFFSHSYLYYREISLRLLFPEHYFL